MLGHELRNSLAAIASALGVMNHTMRDDQRAARPRDVIARQLEHVPRIVDDLLDAGRVATGKIRLQRQPVNVSDAVEQVIAMFRETGGLADHEIEVKTAPGWVHADTTRLHQMVSNLLSNAIKYTPARKRIMVSAAVQSNYVSITVTDEGIGIAPEALPRVFEMFYQGEATLDRTSGGLGIGPSLVRRLAELHGGEACVWERRPWGRRELYDSPATCAGSGSCRCH